MSGPRRRINLSTLDVIGVDAVIAELSAFTDRMRCDGVMVTDILVTPPSFEHLRVVTNEAFSRRHQKGPRASRIVLDLPTGPVTVRPVEAPPAPPEASIDAALASGVES